MQVDSSLFRKLAHFYTERFTVFLPEFTQISNQTFTWINNGNITTKYIRIRNKSEFFFA